jgi:hypothetical protein
MLTWACSALSFYGVRLDNLRALDQTWRSTVDLSPDGRRGIYPEAIHGSVAGSWIRKREARVNRASSRSRGSVREASYPPPFRIQ